VKLLFLRGIFSDGGVSGCSVRLVLLLGSFPWLMMLLAPMDGLSGCWLVALDWLFISFP
jgi:hypothetical protein